MLGGELDRRLSFQLCASEKEEKNPFFFEYCLFHFAFRSLLFVFFCGGPLSSFVRQHNRSAHPPLRSAPLPPCSPNTHTHTQPLLSSHLRTLIQLFFSLVAPSLSLSFFLSISSFHVFFPLFFSSSKPSLPSPTDGGTGYQQAFSRFQRRAYLLLPPSFSLSLCFSLFVARAKGSILSTFSYLSFVGEP